MFSNSIVLYFLKVVLFPVKTGNDSRPERAEWKRGFGVSRLEVGNVLFKKHRAVKSVGPAVRRVTLVLFMEHDAEMSPTLLVFRVQEESDQP